jgi:cyclase
VLINSHHHPDHTGGNGVLRPSAKQIVAHARSKEDQVVQGERMKATPTLPDVTSTETWSVTLGALLNNRGYPNVDAPAGASVHGWTRVLEQMAPAYPADALYVDGQAEAGHPFIGTRADLLSQRDYFTAVIAYAARARKEGRAREELAKVDVLPRFEQFGGIKSRLGLALTIAYDELAKMG